ncbi:MAG: hypothetical protein HY537_14170 [Deltaproteobacteria bacterium]|nr:hypothetical protein [Deltaproteobacteria bacterium]
MPTFILVRKQLTILKKKKVIEIELTPILEPQDEEVDSEVDTEEYEYRDQECGMVKHPFGIGYLSKCIH